MHPKNFTNIKEDVPLKNYTTFRIGGPARFFAEVKTIDELKESIEFSKQEDAPIFILGGGSNIIVNDAGFDGLVIRPRFLGFKIENETVSFGSGENWDAVVRRCVDARL